MRDLKFPRRKLAIEKFTQEPTTIGFQTMVSPGKRSFVPANCDFSKSSDFENIEKWENEMWTLMVGWAKEHLACSKTDEMLAQRLTRVSMAYAKGVRQMSGGHHASPQGGLDGLVRKYLPEDHHVTALHCFILFRCNSMFSGCSGNSGLVHQLVFSQQDRFRKEAAIRCD